MCGARSIGLGPVPHADEPDSPRRPQAYSRYRDPRIPPTPRRLFRRQVRTLLILANRLNHAGRRDRLRRTVEYSAMKLSRLLVRPPQGIYA